MAKKHRPSNSRKRPASNNLRIIGGEWRSRKLPFADAPGLRPTPDRIRETLFNWLQGDVHGAVCLDLFAGSGALGFEALSRGASTLTLVEKNRQVVQQLQANISLLKTESVTLVQADGLSFLETCDTSFDLVFLDPPYRQGLLEKSLRLLCDDNPAKALLKPQAKIYLEHESEQSFDWQAFGLQTLKQAKAGQVDSFLLEKI